MTVSAWSGQPIITGRGGGGGGLRHGVVCSALVVPMHRCRPTAAPVLLSVGTAAADRGAECWRQTARDKMTTGIARRTGLTKYDEFLLMCFARTLETVENYSRVLIRRQVIRQSGRPRNTPARDQETFISRTVDRQSVWSTSQHRGVSASGCVWVRLGRTGGRGVRGGEGEKDGREGVNDAASHSITKGRPGSGRIPPRRPSLRKLRANDTKCAARSTLGSRSQGQNQRSQDRLGKSAGMSCQSKQHG